VRYRPLSMDEGRRPLQRITVRLRRAIMVLMTAQGRTVRGITSLLQVTDDYVRDVIHSFNERGFDALDPKPSGDARRRSESSSAPGSARSPAPPADRGGTGQDRV
jgi:hypothetical protein